MENVFSWLNGKKTYITGMGTLITGCLVGAGVMPMPPAWVFVLAGGLGLNFLRSGVQKVADNATD